MLVNDTSLGEYDLEPKQSLETQQCNLGIIILLLFYSDYCV